MFGRFSKSMMKKIFFCSARHGVVPKKFEIFSGHSNNYSKIKASLTFRIEACVRYFLSNFHFFIKWYFFIKCFWRAIIWWKNKNLMKIADTSFKFNQWFLWSCFNSTSCKFYYLCPYSLALGFLWPVKWHRYDLFNFMSRFDFEVYPINNWSFIIFFSCSILVAVYKF